MSRVLLAIGAIMVVVGILIMYASLESPGLIAFQIMILGGMFFGLGIVVISIGVLNNSIKELSIVKKRINTTEISREDLLRLRDELKKS